MAELTTGLWKICDCSLEHDKQGLHIIHIAREGDVAHIAMVYSSNGDGPANARRIVEAVNSDEVAEQLAEMVGVLLLADIFGDEEPPPRKPLYAALAAYRKSKPRD